MKEVKRGGMGRGPENQMHQGVPRGSFFQSSFMSSGFPSVAFFFPPKHSHFSRIYVFGFVALLMAPTITPFFLPLEHGAMLFSTVV